MSDKARWYRDQIVVLWFSGLKIETWGTLDDRNLSSHGAQNREWGQT
jgi:hypothetical protein